MNWRSGGAVRALGKEFYAEVKDDGVTTLAAAFAYHTVFAIPALLILTVTVAALLNRATDIHVAEHLRDLIRDRAPADTRDLLNSIVDDAIAKVGGGGASLGTLLTALLALWSGSNAVGALIEAFNRAYDVEEGRPFVKKKLLTLGLTLVLALSVNIAFVLLVFGERIGHWIADQAGLGSAFDVIWNLSRWPLAIAAVALILAVLYYAGPDVEQSFRWSSPGSILATAPTPASGNARISSSYRWMACPACGSGHCTSASMPATAALCSTTSASSTERTSSTTTIRQPRSGPMAGPTTTRRSPGQRWPRAMSGGSGSAG